MPVPDQRRLAVGQCVRLRDLLLECPVVGEAESRRQTLVPQLEDEFGGPLGLVHNARNDLEVVNLLKACLRYGFDHGLNTLVTVIEHLDNNIEAVKDLRASVKGLLTPILPEEMLAELASIASPELVSDEKVRQLAHESAPDLNRQIDPEAGVLVVIYKLADRNVQVGEGQFPYPIVAFAELLARDVGDESVVATLRNWISRAGSLLGIEPQQLDELRARPEGWHQGFRPYLLVQVTPHGPNKEALIRTARMNNIDAWLVDEHGCQKFTFHESATCTLQQLERPLQGWIERLVELLPATAAKLTIEWFLPRSLLSHPVDQLSLLVNESIDLRSKIGQEYRVVVRWLDRANNYFALAHWLEKWPRLLSRVSTPGLATVSWVHHGNGEDPRVLYNRLIRSDEELCLGLTMSGPGLKHEEDLLVFALQAGIPAVIWIRKPVHDLEAFLTEVEERLRTDGYAALPELVREKRLAAQSEDDHVGSQLALLWDDPGRPLPGTSLSRDCPRS